MSNLLQTAVNFSLLEQGYEIGLDWLGHFARVIIEGVGIVGLGIIVFTLVLKAITLPFDIYQRVKMRKQNLIMREMQPELEKLQKQYANDKTMYSQKMLELQKKSGYSILGACLPMIISLVILIVAFSGFRTYSQYANLNLFVKMSEQYNAAILSNGSEGTTYRIHTDGAEDDAFTIPFAEGVYNAGDSANIYEMFYYEELVVTSEGGLVVENGTFKTQKNTSRPYMSVKAADESKYVYYVYPMTGVPTREYRIDVDRLLACTDDETLREKITENLPSPADTTVEAVTNKQTRLGEACRNHIVQIGAGAAADYFRNGQNAPSFLWIKNVWYPDVSYDHPIPSYADFASQLNTEVTLNGREVAVTSVLNETQYGYLTSQLNEEKEEANGYFILIVLSIALMVVSQLIVMKSSKESNKYQTVDGQGARTQKVMLVIMPLIYALFAFMYSAAFSIYMCMSSIVAILITVFSNLILDKVFSKREEAAFREEHSNVPAWMQKREEKNKENKNKRK